jgi:HPt (histidine-containing phosphotransfer) domain-containing protein
MKIPTAPARLDVDDMRRRLGDDDELIGMVLQLFVEHGPEQLGAVKAAVDADQGDAVRRSAHLLKGSAGTLGATGVVAAATALELAAERGDNSLFAPCYATLAVEVEQLLDELN